jgi:dTDP-4-amino-4,6-dideoxygalactose transaminase
MGLRLVPPAGPGSIWRVTGRSLTRGADAWDSVWTELLGPGARFFFSSGRGALAFLLGLLGEEGGSDAPVILPAYTCYSVAAAAVRAGRRVRLCDLSPETLELDLERIREWCRTGPHVVVAASLLGVPCNVAELETACRETGALLIDDAAQTLGARPGRRPAGSYGDAGIFSTGRGKIISGFHGGILTIRDSRLAGAAARRFGALPAHGLGASLGALALYFLSPLLQHPRLFWLPAAIPALGIGRTVFDPSFPVGRLRLFSRRVLGSAAPDVEAANQRRRRAAGEWIRCLEGLPVRFLTSGDAVYPRLGVLFPDRAAAERGVAAARRAGVMASRLYPEVLADVPELAGHRLGDGEVPGARSLRDRLVTLPTHRYLSPADMARVRERWEGVLA